MQLEYFISGNSNKETLLFVHGAGGNAEQFQKQHEYFSENYRVVSLSLRGHGASPKPLPNATEQYALAVLADDIIHLVDKLGLDRIHYVGNSAGGVLGYLVCSKKAKQFLSLTTFGTTAEMKFPKITAPLVRFFDKTMIRFFGKAYFRFIAKHTSENHETRKALFSMFQQASEAIPHIRYHLARYNYLKQVEDLKTPYFLIECEWDKGINGMLASTKKAMALNGNAKVKYLKGVAHMANLDNPDAFNALLMEIIKEVNK